MFREIARIAPHSTTILGWVWTQGSLKATPHRLSSLATCKLPTTVSQLRSFLGAYKFIARTVPNCASYLAPLEDLTSGKQPTDAITWSDAELSTFRDAQTHLSKSRSITIPRRQDQLWIVTDSAVKNHGIGATMYVTRNSETLVAGYLSAKLQKRQTTWISCEIEALAIGCAVRHFAPYIIDSQHRTCILTDSRPCVLAFGKLLRGEFSVSPRVYTFLASASRYPISIRHLAGEANLPTDFASRNAAECHEPTCQVCSFVQETQSAAVHQVTVTDVLSGKARLPFTSQPAWLQMQSECPDLRRTRAHLLQGTRPSRKLTNATDVKRYLNHVTAATDGLLVVRTEDAFAPTRERIVIPRRILHGILTALHIQLGHPTAHQLLIATKRYFYAINLDDAVKQVCRTCEHCESLKKVPHALLQQSTTDPPLQVGMLYAADVIRRERQAILVLRECYMSYTAAQIVPDERHETLRDALLCLLLRLRSICGADSHIRVDPAPSSDPVFVTTPYCHHITSS